MLKTVLKVVAGLVLLAVLGVVGLVVTLRHPMPEAAPSAEGDALAQKVLTSATCSMVSGLKWATPCSRKSRCRFTISWAMRVMVSWRW